jgi:phenolic acid decarboxylase
MRQRILKILSLIYILFGVLNATAGASRVQEKTMSFQGKKVLIRYKSGLEVKAHYKNATTLEWEALTGDSKGMKGTEKIHALEVAPNVFFINWLENSGVTVSQVLDLNKFVVSSFVTFDSGTGRQSMLDEGTVIEIPD